MTGPHVINLASTVFLLKGDSVFLLRRSNTGYRDGFWSAVGGRLEAGESFLSCAVREAAEEVGAKIDPAALGEPVMHHGSDEIGTRIIAFYACRKWSGAPSNLEPDKHDRAQWFPLTALPPGMTPYVRAALESLLSPRPPSLFEEGFPAAA